MSIKVLIACEESQEVCKAFRKIGFEAYSCDLKDCSGEHPEWHLKMDVFEAIRLKEWDLMIAHPPCTFLSTSGNRWMNDKVHYPNREQDRKEAIEFFLKIATTPIRHIAIENPIGIMSSIFEKPTQIIQPYFFGDSVKKTTCLWLKNLPKLNPTKMVDPGEIHITKSGRKMSKWYYDALYCKTPEERRTYRSKTFPGIAKAMAEQWGNYVALLKYIEEKKK